MANQNNYNAQGSRQEAQASVNGVMKFRGKDYVLVSERVRRFREEGQHPDGCIKTVPVEINLELRYAIFRAEIYDGTGRLLATAHNMETAQGFSDYIEKSETSAIGRALGFCGYGDVEESREHQAGRPVDGPVQANGYQMPALAQEATQAPNFPVAEPAAFVPFKPEDKNDETKALYSQFQKMAKDDGYNVSPDHLFGLYNTLLKRKGEGADKPMNAVGIRACIKRLESMAREAEVEAMNNNRNEVTDSE